MELVRSPRLGESRAFWPAGTMTNVCPGAAWPSISPISEVHGDAVASPSIEREELSEGREEGQDLREVPAPPEAHIEVRPPRVARRPVLPTKADIAEHFRNAFGQSWGVPKSPVPGLTPTN